MAIELAITQAVQALSFGGLAVMDFVFASFTFLAEQTFLFLAIFAVYWSVDKRRGELLIFSLFAALAVNGGLKDAARRPRPFQTEGFESARFVRMENPLVDTVHLKDSFSFPSGHSQCAGAFYGTLALETRRRRVTILCALAILLVMLSRVYLGVHFPSDVAAGAMLGLGCAALATAVFRRFYRHRLWLFGAVTALALATLLQDFSIDTFKTTWLGVGCFLGLVAEARWIRFDIQGPAGGRILRAVLGCALAGVLVGGLKLLLPSTLLFIGLRYGLLGLFCTGLWPAAFTKLGL